MCVCRQSIVYALRYMLFYGKKILIFFCSPYAVQKQHGLAFEKCVVSGTVAQGRNPSVLYNA